MQACLIQSGVLCQCTSRYDAECFFTNLSLRVHVCVQRLVGWFWCNTAYGD